MNTIEILKKVQNRYKNVFNKTEEEKLEAEGLNQVFKQLKLLKEKNKELKQDVKDISKDYVDLTSKLLDYIEAMEIIKEKHFIVIIGLEKFKWDKELKEYIYLEEATEKVYTIDEYEYELLEKTLGYSF